MAANATVAHLVSMGAGGFLIALPMKSRLTARMVENFFVCMLCRL
jgi:hypothetical protein